MCRGTLDMHSGGGQRLTCMRDFFVVDVVVFMRVFPCSSGFI